MPEKNLSSKNSNKTTIVTNILKTALKLWLRSQVSQVSHLEVEIRASDRQILTGCIPWVSIIADHAVYQGLHLTRIQLVAENIHINIGSILKGQPLRLLATVPVFCELSQSEEELNASLSSALLSTALNDVLIILLPEYCLKTKPISWQKINIDHSKVILTAILISERNFTPFNIGVSLELLSDHELQLTRIKVESNTVALLETSENRHYLNLGSDVDIQELILIPGRLECRGRINVNP